MTAPCRVCGRPFVSDRTPMALDAVCMFCRPGVTVRCRRCEVECPGAFDGLMMCPACRSVPLGQQQYEDKSRPNPDELARIHAALAADRAAVLAATESGYAVTAEGGDMIIE